MVFEGSGTGGFASEVGGLIHQTRYFVSAFATNSAGTAYGTQVEFTTKHTGTPCPGAATVTDIDGNIYNTVLIGGQCWLKENLRTTKFSDGTPLTYTESMAHGSSTYAWPGRNSEYKDVYGALYNYATVRNPKGICPTGWHVPTEEEWNKLKNYLINNYPDVTANNVGNKLKSCRQVNSPVGGGCLTDEHPRWNHHHNPSANMDDFGFSVLPAGYISDMHNLFVGNTTYFWASDPAPGAYGRGALFLNSINDFFTTHVNTAYLVSIRCIK